MTWLWESIRAKGEGSAAATQSTPQAVRYLLAILIAYAFLVRFLRCGEGLPYIHGWDEPQTAGTALRIMQTGDFNPHFFTYGSVTIYLHLLVDILHYFYLMGQPESAPSFLTNLTEIRTQFDTGWIWTISHPSFYFWNRALVAAMGTGAVGLVYLLGRRLAGWAAGLLAASLLTGLEVHIQHSALITPDVPASVFVLSTVLLSTVFLERGRPIHLIAALAAAGLAASTKYNAVPAVVVPTAALAFAALSRSPGHRRWLWLALGVVPAAAFVAGTPFAVGDLGNFLKSAGTEVRVYKVTGLIGNVSDQIEPGLTQLSLQLRTMGQHLGWAGSGLAALGLIAVLFRRAGSIVLLYPAIYLVLMIDTRVPLHRNFVVLYPFAAIAFGVAVVTLIRGARRLASGRSTMTNGVTAAVVVLAGVAIAPPLAAAATGWRAAREPESRTTAMIRMAERASARDRSGLILGIEEELRVHGQDLKKLGVPYEVHPYLDLLCHAGKYSLVARAARHGAFFAPNAGPVDLLDDPRVAATFRVLDSAGQGVLHLDIVSINPEVQIVEPAPPGSVPDPVCVGDARPLEMRSSRPVEIDDRGALLMASEGTVGSPGFLIPAGSYAFGWRASGTRAAGKSATLKATVTAAAESGGPEVMKDGTFETNFFMREFALRFDLREEALVVLELDFINDYHDPASREDRNVHLETIRLLRLR